MKQRFRSALASVTALALGILAAPPLKAQDYPAMNLRFAHYLPATFAGSVVDKWFADEVQRRSNGKIKIQIFWAESMGKSTELLDLVAKGAVDMSATSQGYFPSQLPLVGMTNSVMMLFDSNEEALRINAELMQRKAMQDELRRNQVYPIFFHAVNTFRPFCSKKLDRLEDFKGKKMRSWGEYVPLLWQSLGATPVTVLPAEFYESLQRGTVDCMFLPIDLTYNLKLYEVAKFTWDKGLGAIPTWPIWVNWKTYHEVWPPQVRKLIEEVAREAVERDVKTTRDAEATALKAMTSSHGVQVARFNDMDRLEKTVPDLLATWVTKMEARGLGNEAREVAEFVRKRRAELRKSKP
ncbi:MAG TPA: TRAP transporter substrate-binding protein DctP [Burkholderiales bacterium]|jgi:TRAP-type C4-dicarboxylate transport system substrate-binding protein|nr:TRAP transporter substrate-binding protein DctP [Burkholderiales bacterium]